jgi:hypothetical protein
MARKQVLAILGCAKDQGILANFSEAKHKRALKALVDGGIAKIVSEERADGVTYVWARFA